MKIRNLLLGSLAVAGLSTTGAFAADLGVLTSLDVCDNLGLSGLTISSDTNCLQITGEVKYHFYWGDYQTDSFAVRTGAGNYTAIGGDGESDWDTRFDAWLKAVGTADSDFGPAKAVIKLKQVQHRTSNDNVVGVTSLGSDADGAGPGTASVTLTTFTDGVNIAGIGSSDTGGVIMDEAYVSIGDSTVIMAGKKGSIMNKGDDEPLNFLGLFNSEKVDLGVSWGPFDRTGEDSDGLGDGGHVIQVVSDLGNGLSIGAGLEKLDALNLAGGAGTAVGVISYAGEGISAHITGAAAGVLDGEVEAWGVHSGFSGSFDNFKVVLAGAFGHLEAFDTPALSPVTGLPVASFAGGDHWNVLASAAATFDMFTIAGSVEAVNSDFTTAGETDVGAGLSITAAVTDTVQLNVGGRWYREEANDVDNFQVAAQVIAAVTETLTLTGEIGWLSNNRVPGNTDSVAGTELPGGDVFYGSAKVAWAPGGGYTASLLGKVTSGNDDFNVDPGYKIETEFKKTFE